jgi:hypothetical protein
VSTKVAVNKSQLIRDMLAAQPSLQPSEIAAELKAQGVKGVSAQYVSTIKSNAKAKANGRPMNGRKGKGLNGHAGLVNAARFIKSIGDPDKAIALVEEAADVVKALKGGIRI